MSSLDFALKDIYRKKETTIPYLIIIILITAFTEFFIYFTSYFGLNMIIPSKFENKYFFTGSISLIYTQFTTFILVLVVIMAIIITVFVTTTLILQKKKDIAIMKALGTLPDKLYSFYLLEAFIIFIIGFIIGWIFGLISYGIFSLIMYFLEYPFIFYIDWYITPIIFISCILGIFFVSGYALRKLGIQKIVKTFSEDIPYGYNAARGLKLIPRLLARLGMNFKIALTNVSRKKGEYRRYIIIFTLISLITFTLGLGIIVLTNSSQRWIEKSQGDNILIIGHKDVVYNYSAMYQMFSNPNLLIKEDNINFTAPEYLFNYSEIQPIELVSGIEKIDERLINFYDIKELDGIVYTDEGYKLVGKQRQGNFPIIGINPEKIIQNFEIDGRFFTNEDSFENMTIGDGLAYNFFEYPFHQSLEINGLSTIFSPHICGIIIDSFFNGYAGYIGLNESRDLLNLNNDEINLVCVKFTHGRYNLIKDDLEPIIANLGDDFIYLNLETVFSRNLDYLLKLSLYPIFLIIIVAIIAVLSLYLYQRGSIMDKAKDFLIMRAIGSKSKSLKKILFMESLLIFIPAIFLSLGVGMIINSSFLLERVELPPLYVPFAILAIIFIAFILFNILSLIPIIKKINKFTIKDFKIY